MEKIRDIFIKYLMNEKTVLLFNNNDKEHKRILSQISFYGKNVLEFDSGHKNWMDIGTKKDVNMYCQVDISSSNKREKNTASNLDFSNKFLHFNLGILEFLNYYIPNHIENKSSPFDIILIDVSDIDPLCLNEILLKLPSLICPKSLIVTNNP